MTEEEIEVFKRKWEVGAADLVDESCPY